METDYAEFEAKTRRPHGDARAVRPAHGGLVQRRTLAVIA
jgi:hypothetical protein